MINPQSRFASVFDIKRLIWRSQRLTIFASSSSCVSFHSCHSAICTEGICSWAKDLISHDSDTFASSSNSSLACAWTWISPLLLFLWFNALLWFLLALLHRLQCWILCNLMSQHERENGEWGKVLLNVILCMVAGFCGEQGWRLLEIKTLKSSEFGFYRFTWFFNKENNFLSVNFFKLN